MTSQSIHMIRKWSEVKHATSWPRTTPPPPPHTHTHTHTNTFITDTERTFHTTTALCDHNERFRGVESSLYIQISEPNNYAYAVGILNESISDYK